MIIEFKLKVNKQLILFNSEINLKNIKKEQIQIFKVDNNGKITIINKYLYFIIDSKIIFFVKQYCNYIIYRIASSVEDFKKEKLNIEIEELKEFINEIDKYIEEIEK